MTPPPHSSHTQAPPSVAQPSSASAPQSSGAVSTRSSASPPLAAPNASRTETPAGVALPHLQPHPLHPPTQQVVPFYAVPPPPAGAAYAVPYPVAGAPVYMHHAYMPATVPVAAATAAVVPAPTPAAANGAGASTAGSAGGPHYMSVNAPPFVPAAELQQHDQPTSTSGGQQMRGGGIRRGRGRSNGNNHRREFSTRPTILHEMVQQHVDQHQQQQHHHQQQQQHAQHHHQAQHPHHQQQQPHLHHPSHAHHPHHQHHHQPQPHHQPANMIAHHPNYAQFATPAGYQYGYYAPAPQPHAGHAVQVGFPSAQHATGSPLYASQPFYMQLHPAYYQYQPAAVQMYPPAAAAASSAVYPPHEYATPVLLDAPQPSGGDSDTNSETGHGNGSSAGTQTPQPQPAATLWHPAPVAWQPPQPNAGEYGDDAQQQDMQMHQQPTAVAVDEYGNILHAVEQPPSVGHEAQQHPAAYVINASPAHVAMHQQQQHHIHQQQQLQHHHQQQQQQMHHQQQQHAEYIAAGGMNSPGSIQLSPQSTAAPGEAGPVAQQPMPVVSQAQHAHHQHHQQQQMHAYHAAGHPAQPHHIMMQMVPAGPTMVLHPQDPNLMMGHYVMAAAPPPPPQQQQQQSQPLQLLDAEHLQATAEEEAVPVMDVASVSPQHEAQPLHNHNHIEMPVDDGEPQAQHLQHHLRPEQPIQQQQQCQPAHQQQQQFNHQHQHPTDPSILILGNAEISELPPSQHPSEQPQVPFEPMLPAVSPALSSASSVDQTPVPIVVAAAAPNTPQRANPFSAPMPANHHGNLSAQAKAAPASPAAIQVAVQSLPSAAIISGDEPAKLINDKQTINKSPSSSSESSQSSQHQHQRHNHNNNNNNHLIHNNNYHKTNNNWTANHAPKKNTANVSVSAVPMNSPSVVVAPNVLLPTPKQPLIANTPAVRANYDNNNSKYVPKSSTSPPAAVPIANEKKTAWNQPQQQSIPAVQSNHTPNHHSNHVAAQHKAPAAPAKPLAPAAALKPVAPTAAPKPAAPVAPVIVANVSQPPPSIAQDQRTKQVEVNPHMLASQPAAVAAPAAETAELPAPQVADKSTTTVAPVALPDPVPVTPAVEEPPAAPASSSAGTSWASLLKGNAPAAAKRPPTAAPVKPAAVPSDAKSVDAPTLKTYPLQSIYEQPPPSVRPTVANLALLYSTPPPPIVPAALRSSLPAHVPVFNASTPPPSIALPLPMVKPPMSYSAASTQGLPAPAPAPVVAPAVAPTPTPPTTTAAAAAAAPATAAVKKTVGKKAAASAAKTTLSTEDLASVKLGEFFHKYQIDNSPVSLRPRGLINRSTYCYMNVSLQALVACPPFYNLIKAIPEHHVAALRAKGTAATIDAMIELVKEFTGLPPGTRLSTARKPVHKKDDVSGGALNDLATDQPFEPLTVHKLWKMSRAENEDRQEDAEEFLSYLLNKLNDEMLDLKKLADKPVSNGIGSAADTNDDANEDEWKTIQHGTRNNKGTITRTPDFGNTPLSDIFRGSYRLRLHPEGSQPNDTLQPFFTLPLHIEKANNVREALENFSGKTALEGYTCSKTNQNLPASQQMTLEILPLILILHLKCFNYKPDGCTKIVKTVDFPIDLKIDTKILASKKYGNNKKQYRLCAVVYHDGKDATKGHYIVDAHHTGYEYWLRYDDSTVKAVPETLVLHPRANRVPYLLYYRRCDGISESKSSGPAPAGGFGSAAAFNSASSTANK